MWETGVTATWAEAQRDLEWGHTQGPPSVSRTVCPPHWTHVAGGKGRGSLCDAWRCRRGQVTSCRPHRVTQPDPRPTQPLEKGVLTLGSPPRSPIRPVTASRVGLGGKRWEGLGCWRKAWGGRHGSGEGWAGGSGWTTGHSCCNSPHFLSHGSGAGSLKSRRWAGPAPFRGSRRECCLCPRSSWCLLHPWCSWAPATWPSSPCVFTSFSLCAPVSPSYQDTVLLVQGPP